jgi:hypothetical protein
MRNLSKLDGIGGIYFIKNKCQQINRFNFILEISMAKHALRNSQQVSSVISCWHFIIQSRAKHMHFPRKALDSCFIYNILRI